MEKFEKEYSDKYMKKFQEELSSLKSVVAEMKSSNKAQATEEASSETAFEESEAASSENVEDTDENVNLSVSDEDDKVNGIVSGDENEPACEEQASEVTEESITDEEKQISAQLNADSPSALNELNPGSEEVMNISTTESEIAVDTNDADASMETLEMSNNNSSL